MTRLSPASIGRALYGNAYVLLVATTMSWAGNAVAGRFAVGEVSPMALVMVRWLGVVVLVGLLVRGPIARDWPVLRNHLGFIAALGALGFTLFNGLFYIAAHHTTAISLGIIQGAIPIFVLLGAFIAYRTAVTGVQMLGVAITVLGVITVTVEGDLTKLEALHFNHGDLLMIAACALYAGYTVALRKRPAVSGLTMFSVMAVAALIASFPMAAAEAMLSEFQWPTPAGWLIVCYVVLFPSFLAQISFMRGVELIGPGRAGVFVNLVPIFASLFSVLLLDETFSPHHAVALAFVLGGIWIAERARPT